MEYSEESLKEAIERVGKTDRKTRGDLLEIVGPYLEKIGKKDALPAIEKKMAEYGYPVNFVEVKAINFYPLAMEMACLFAMAEALNWNDDEVKKFGRNLTKLSFIEKILVKYFISIDRTFASAPDIWKKHMNSGELEATLLDKEKKYCILRLRNFDAHPLYCTMLAGMFEMMNVYINKSLDNRCEETKCTFRGDEIHEFTVTWK